MDATPRQAPREVPATKSQIVRSTRQAVSEGSPSIVANRHRYPESSDRFEDHGWPSRTDTDGERPPHHAPGEYYGQGRQRTRADSLPLRSLVPAVAAAPTSDGSGRPTLPALARIQTEFAPSRHSRQRSHFSIPDVIVTACEEEGEEEVVELQIPPNKRRSYVLRDAAEEPQDHHRSNKKSTNGFVRRPAPLIQFNSDEIKTIGMVRSGSVPSIASSTNSPTTPDPSPSSPPSSASSSLSKASTTKRSRKSSFPLLFGRKSLDSSRSNAIDHIYVEEPLPFTPTSPFPASSVVAGQPDGLIFSANDSAPMNPPSRGVFTRGVGGLPSPPVTPTSPSRPLSKKEMKAKAKEELALIKELERVDKLVKQHDVKARKVQEKADAKERKRTAKLAQINQQFTHQRGTETRPSTDTYSSARSQTMPAERSFRKTIFQVSTKASASGGLARRTSVRGASELRSFASERRGSEPVLSNAAKSEESRAHITTPFSIDLPTSERLPFSEPRAAPRPKVSSHSSQPLAQGPTRATEPMSPIKAMRRSDFSKESSPPRPLRPAPPVPTQSVAPLSFVKDAEPECDNNVWPEVVDGETSLGEDSDETRGWNRQSWSELNSGFTGQLPSLISSGAGSSGHAGIDVARGTEEAEDVFETDVQCTARIARRASVQRVLALSDAEGGILQKRASLRKRGSQQYLKRRSSHMDGFDVLAHGRAGECSSKRSSAASDAKRRSFIRHLGDDRGWTVVDGAGELSRPDDSIVAQPDLSGARWDEWVEEHDGMTDLAQSSSVREKMEVEVDLVLADLRAAQHTDRLRKQSYHAHDGSGERTPTQESVKDPFATRTVRKPSPPRPSRSSHRKNYSPSSPTKECSPHSSSTSSADSFSSNSSGTGTTAATVAEPVCFSRPFSPQHRSRISLEQGEGKENPVQSTGSGKEGRRSDFRLSLALAPLQLQSMDLFGSTEAKV